MRSAIIGGAIILIFIMIYAMSGKSSVANTAAGGVAATGSPSANAELSASGELASFGSCQVGTSSLVKKIVITRDTEMMPNASPIWFNIGEVQAYSGTRLLVGDDFSDAVMYPNIHVSDDLAVPNDATVSSLTLILKKPARLTQINVLNRLTCCWNRLDGASLILYNTQNELIFKETLRKVHDLQVYPVSM